MHTVFFGGLAQFYDDNGTLVQDDNVPFVNTIARVTRGDDGVMAEFKLPIEMPALLGAGGEFIPNLNSPYLPNNIFKLDELTMDPVLIGYIFGGISSSARNIFFVNNGTQSEASSQVFEVHVRKPTTVSTDNLNSASTSTLNLRMYPNPNEGDLRIAFNLISRKNVELSISDLKGNLIDTVRLKNLLIGENTYQLSLNHLTGGSVYLITLSTPEERVSRRIIVAE
jgi:hypothetical protein